MPEYLVSWWIDVTADSPREAAEKAREIQLDPKAWANAFEVTEYGSAEPGIEVDLEDSDDG